MAKKVSARQAAIDYLRENNGGPCPVKEVTAEAARRAKLKGKTPEATVAAQLYVAAKKGHLFAIPERGMVALLPETAANGDGATESGETAEGAADGEASLAGDLSREARTAGRRQAKPDPKPAPSKKRQRVHA